MKSRTAVRTVAGYLAGGAALAAVGYAAYAATAWTRYGHARRPRGPEEEDPFLEELMPHYDIVERHHVRVAAPRGVTVSVRRDLQHARRSGDRRCFMGRGVIPRAEPTRAPAPPALRSPAWSRGS